VVFEHFLQIIPMVARSSLKGMQQDPSLSNSAVNLKIWMPFVLLKPLNNYRLLVLTDIQK
jgi:hypothetical protein